MIPADIVKKEWATIKKQFSEHYKTYIASARTVEPSWSLWPNLAFIRECADRAVGRISGNLDELFVNIESIDAPSDASAENTIKSLPQEPEKVKVKMAYPQSHKINMDESECSDDLNEDKIYFNSLLTHMRRVPKKDKLALRNKINEIVREYAYKPEEFVGYPPHFAVPQSTHYPLYYPNYPLIKSEPVMKKRRRIDYTFMDSGRNYYQNEDNDVQFVGEFKKVVVKTEPKRVEKREANSASLRGEIFCRLKVKKIQHIITIFLYS